MCLYADDSTLFCVSPNNHETQHAVSLNKDLEQISTWGRTWKVLFAPEKCKVMTITNKGSNHHPPLLMDGNELDECEELDLLGVTFTHNMSFGTHVKKVASRAGKSVSVMRRISSRLNPVGRQRVYNAHIRSKMEYAPLAWGSASATSLRSLDDIQVRASKIIKPSQPMQTLSHRRTVASMGLMYRMASEDAPPLLNQLMPDHHIPGRSTRASSNYGEHAVKHLAGKDPRTHTWSLHQYDHSFLPAAIQTWNLLPGTVVSDPYKGGSKDFCKRVHHYLINSDH